MDLPQNLFQPGYANSTTALIDQLRSGGLALVDSLKKMQAPVQQVQNPPIKPAPVAQAPLHAQAKAMKPGQVVSTPQPLPPVTQSATSTTFIDLTNQYRKEQGLPTLTFNPLLSKSAQLRADEIAKDPTLWDKSKPGTHVSSNGKNYYDVIDSVGYKRLGAGENLAKEFNSLEEAMAALKKSPTHNANLINPRFKDIGIGYATLPNGKWVVVQNFGYQTK